MEGFKNAKFFGRISHKNEGIGSEERGGNIGICAFMSYFGSNERDLNPLTCGLLTK